MYYKQIIGKKGEKIAAKYLTENGETAVLTRDIQEPIARRLIKEHRLVDKRGKLIIGTWQN